MHLKQNGHSFGVLLIYTITTINLHPTGWCKPTALTFQTVHGGEEEWRELPYSENLQEATTGKQIGPTMSTMSSSSLRNDTKQSDNHINGNCREGNITRAVLGKFYTTGRLEANLPATGYQSDAAVSAQIQGSRIGVEPVSTLEESWRKLQPVVACGDEGMSLTVRRRRAVQLLLDRENESSVPLSQLPPQCGYSVQASWRDLSLMAQYDACHITQEDDSYVLPLLWMGTPVMVSCPVSRITSQAVGPSSLCCSDYGIAVKINGLSDTDELRINVRDEWIPLSSLVRDCGYTVDEQDTDVVIQTPYDTCGIRVKDGKYTVPLQIGEEIFTLTCPVSHPGEPATPQPPVDSFPLPPPLIRAVTKAMQASQEPFRWAPPFYLAPLYYPHPTKHYSNTSPDLKDLYYPPTAPSLPPETPRPLHSVDSQPDYQVCSSHHAPLKEAVNIHSSLSSRDEMDETSPLYPAQNQDSPVLDLSETQSVTPTNFPAQVEAPHIQPANYDFNPYYHYYHHPKIPLHDPSQDLDPGPQLSGEVSPTNSHDRDFLGRLSAEDLGPVPVSDTTSRPNALPTNPKFVRNPSALHTTHPPQPYPHFYPTPHVALGKAKRLDPLANLPNVQSLPHLLVLEDNTNPYTQDPSPDIKTEEYSPECSDDVKPEPGDDKRRSAHPVPVSDLPSYPTSLDNPYHHYYYNPYYNYYLENYGPEGVLSADKRTHCTHARHPSNPTRPTIAPQTESVYYVQNSPFHAYYYPHLYNQPEEPQHQQELQPRGRMDSFEPSKSEFPSDSQYNGVEWVIHGAEGGYASIPLKHHDPSHSLDSHYITQRHAYDPFKQQGGVEAEEKPANEMRVPDSESTALSLEDSYVYCWLQRQTPKLDVYIILLDGCGLKKHKLGDKVRLSDEDSHQDVSSDKSVRLMVGCKEEELQPPLPPIQSTPFIVSLRLRIATDESFTSYHPEAHLPLSLIQGRPVYVELSLLDPSDLNLVLLVHSCVAYTQPPHASWMPVYDGCPSQAGSQLLPSTNPHHIQRILIYNFLSLPLEGYRLPGDPEIYFLCLTQVCSAADSECSVSCLTGPNSDVQ
ncbi:uncharacterized protein LOC124997390 [Mugil cephalus]|uniref:uncharacterized protein LOC124997390 n=1 Tax=Mugil cephalus TaxID=48193 RepID=UPI001FB7E4E6|nr:uncharacterized protein LOC124997390 [Mugil cephalus]